jgi:glucose-6-phosphate isomerase
MLPTITPTETQAWQQLEMHFMMMQATHMRELFDQDPDRFNKFSIRFEDILLDYSKNLITGETIQLLLQLAEETELKAGIEAMFKGSRINQTEDRSVLHVALRNRSNTPMLADGQDVMGDVNRVLQQINSFSTSLLEGTWKGIQENLLPTL